MTKVDWVPNVRVPAEWISDFGAVYGPKTLDADDQTFD